MTVLSQQQKRILYKDQEIALPIFLDHQSTTPLAPEVEMEMFRVLEHPGNAQSKSHVYGLYAQEIIEKARHKVARLIDANDDEIFFANSASEANRLILFHLASQVEGKAHFITSEIEHSSILKNLRSLEENGATLTILPVDQNGKVDPGKLEKAITPKNTIVTIQAANNEIGTCQDLKVLAEICAAKGALFHTDAVQALTTRSLTVKELSLTALGLSGHKLYGPQGIGAYFLRRGYQENLKPEFEGTPSAALIAGLGKACDLAHTNVENDNALLLELRNRFLQPFKESQISENIVINGYEKDFIPGCISLTFQGIRSEDLLLEIPQIACSAGSACTSSTQEPSHILKAIGLDSARADSTVRIGLGRYVTAAEVDYAANVMLEAYIKLRGL
ncbi:MAG: cysteine desulfurase [Sneathiellales bacterium]|nr:cysteine desulfurase [Sneathiellales bacterium]